MGGRCERGGGTANASHSRCRPPYPCEPADTPQTSLATNRTRNQQQVMSPCSHLSRIHKSSLVFESSPNVDQFGLDCRAHLSKHRTSLEAPFTQHCTETAHVTRRKLAGKPHKSFEADLKLHATRSKGSQNLAQQRRTSSLLLH